MKYSTTLPTANGVSSILTSCLPGQYLGSSFDGLYRKGPVDSYEEGRLHLVWMTKQLETIFGELGITQYLGTFVDQGFDTWETILDITESDL